jgi:hypothetical protein
LSGCNTFANGKLVQQLQNENNRLLTEFRAERQRREEMERVNATLEARLSESEKLLARQLGDSPGRLSSLQPLPRGSQSSGQPGEQQPVNNEPRSADGESAGVEWQRRVN